jgi:tetratricopeptide (TPR) repeat protein
MAPNHSVLLLSLADEYFTAAYKLNSQSESYFKLIATGLGCLESVLTNFKLPALREAQISLRYAQVLYEETENYDDAERILTKAIDICERQNFVDLKYTLQILSACVLYQSKPKAAIKDLQNMLEEIEAYNHTAWEYATRYQLTTFYLSATAVRDLHAAIQNIEKLSDAADSNGDKAVAAFANVISALLHLQTSSPDAVSSCQQALARTRALSTDDEVSSIHQIMLMMEYIDLCCSIRECNHTQGDEKRRRMQDTWTALVDKKGWIYDGDMLYLPIHESSLRGLQLQHGGLVRQRKDKYMLPFSWIGMNDAEAWGFLLCAISKAHKNNIDGGKAEAFIDHGLQRTRDANPFRDQTVGGVTSPQQKILECRFLVELAFLQCQKGQWNKANEAIKTIGERANDVGVSFPHSMSCIVEYLNGSIQQGLGNLDTALVSYQWEEFDMKQFMHTPEPKSSQHRFNDSEHATVRDIAILAAMNRLLIISDSSNPQHNQCPTLIEQLNTLVKASQDKNIKASYTLIQSLVTNTGILRSKQALITALHAAKAISNAQITALVLMTMQQKHFLGVTDEHATKCVRATSMQMKNWGNPMWMHVAAGVEAEALEFQGKPVEARGKMQEARVRAEGLPEAVRGLLKM